MIKKGEEIVVKSGRFQGLTFRMEGDTDDAFQGKDLPTAALMGNWAALNALSEDKYKVEDAPFYYGKIGSLGYVISGKDLGI